MHKKIKLEKYKLCLILSSVFSAIIIIGLLILGYLVIQDGVLQRPCETDSCMSALCQIRSKIDTNVKACDDFYQFACGNYDRETLIPEDKLSMNVFNHFGDKLIKQIWDLLAEPSSDSEIKPFKQAKQLFGSCMNLTAIDSAAGKPLLRLIDKIGGWPMLQGKLWNEFSWELFETIVGMRNNGIAGKFILKMAIDISLNDTTKRMIYFDSPETSVHVDFLKSGWNDTYVRNYMNFISDIMVMLGAQKTPFLNSEIREMIEFEVNLTKIVIPHRGRRNPQQLFNVMTISDMQTKYPYFNWLKFLRESYPNLNFSSNEVISVTDLNFFENFGKLVQRTSKRTIANYLMWRLTAQAIPYLSQKFKQRDTEYQILFYGEHKRQPRWRDCVSIVLVEMSIAASAMYARRHFNHNSKMEAESMVANIKDEFEKVLSSASWMDKITRKQAFDKLEKMTAHVGYPKELENDTAIVQFYSGLELDERNEFFESVLINNRFVDHLWSSLLREPANRNDWRMLSNIVEINAYYDAAENKMRIPAGIFQDHFFSSNRPKYLNYGAIGFVIGHEITHGYDDLGSRFDSNGNLNNWWQNSTKETYINKTRCVIEQYAKFREPSMGIPLNGVSTLGENIADNGGIKIAYRAYKKYLMSHRREPGLFTLNYTPEQLFWIQNAQTWCSVYRKETLQSLFRVGTLTPGKYRVLGYLQNSKEFAEDFNCPLNSPMNPSEKCEVW
uniref:CSON001488 protein n=1 Tax=Culicoides sonorensis TaxID=179676 RepID=A0A336KWM6_CULSO